MIRFRRRTCVTLGIIVLFICSVMMGLKTLRPDAAAFGNPFGLGLLPKIQRPTPPKVPEPPNSAGENMAAGTKGSVSPKRAAPLIAEDWPAPNDHFHVFYYAWYGNPQFDDKYVHWNHPILKHWDAKLADNFPSGVHSPPEDIGANYYPELGPYSSRDPSTLEAQMKQMRSASIGVISLSWYPPGMSDDNGEASDNLVSTILDKAHKYGLKVNFHMEPYRKRDDRSTRSDIVYIVDKYGSHPAFYRYKTSTGSTLPLYYVYDSYLTSTDKWANLLTPSGSQSIRNTPYDGIFISLLVEEKHKNEILRGGFDGLYTYFATNGFSYGSSHQHWSGLKTFCDTNNLMFVPSVGPGYIDTSIRPWNFQNTRNRVNGKYYETALTAALSVRPSIISITSFNEWHEGTQIEPAIPKKNGKIKYEDYLPHKPNVYLELTRKWSEKYNQEREQWLV